MAQNKLWKSTWLPWFCQPTGLETHRPTVGSDPDLSKVPFLLALLRCSSAPSLAFHRLLVSPLERDLYMGGISVSCNSLDKYFILKRRKKVTLASLLQPRLSQEMSSAQTGMGAAEVLHPAEGTRRMVPLSVTFPLNLPHHLARPPQPPQTNPHSMKWPGRSLHSCWGYWKQGWSGKLP